MYQSPLSLWIFEPFLRDLKTELGYPVDIGKLKQLLEWSSSEYAQKGTVSIDRVYRVCRVLYLQDPKEHENIFEALFRKHILAIEEWCMELKEDLSRPETDRKKEQLNRDQKQVDDEKHEKQHENQTLKQEKEDTKQKIQNQDRKTEQKSDSSPSHIAEPADEKVEEKAKSFKYLNIELVAEGESAPKANGSAFILNDAFLQVSRREIAHAWRYLRAKDGLRESNFLDVPATVAHIAKNRIPDRLIFQREPVNREDLLTIFVDRGGSMTPFHYLSDVIVKTARGDGGHKMAKVYYYYNVPSNYVYEEPSLTKPIMLSKVYSDLNPSHATVLIISDGGAMRGRYNEIRLKKTLAFLNGSADGNAIEGLQKRVRFIAWLNPMPLHRWYGTTVMDTLRYSDIPMFSILDLGKDSLLQAVHSLMGKL